VSDVEYTWRDSELQARPLLALNWAGRGLGRLGLDAPALRPTSVMKAATKMAGSDDFGGDSFREPLEVFLRSCEAEAELTTFGRILVSKMLASSLSNRIALHRWSIEHPEVRDERIERPWVIVGLPRTGTSLLSLLLGLDPVARPLLQWEAAHPIPPPTLEEAAEDPRIARTAKDLEGLLKLNPPLKAMHPFGATLAEECVSLFMYDVRSLALETQAHVPSYARWLEQADMTPAYAQHRLALQTFQSRQPTERWILKTPNHLWHLDALLSAYPDARVIWTHRDPGPVVTSLASLANAGQRILTSRSDPRPTAEEWKRKCAFAPVAAGASTCTTTPWSAIRWSPSEGCTGASERRSVRCTPGACVPSSNIGLRTSSAVTATTRPTSVGRTPAWPRSSGTTSSDITSRPRPPRDLTASLAPR
jgi:hypothetical protein